MKNYFLPARHAARPGRGYRFLGYLNHINRVGDVLGESRGGKEDRLLKESYSRVFERGAWGVTRSSAFQSALTSGELKLKPKGANISGLQLADMLGHPVKQWVLNEFGATTDELAPFARRLIGAIEGKFNRHLYDGRVAGYGAVLFPRGQK